MASQKEEADKEVVVVFDKYKKTGLYVNKLNTHLEEEGATATRKNPRQRVNSADNEDVKRIKSDETQDKEGWDWREVGEGEKVELQNVFFCSKEQIYFLSIFLLPYLSHFATLGCGASNCCRRHIVDLVSSYGNTCTLRRSKALYSVAETGHSRKLDLDPWKVKMCQMSLSESCCQSC